MADEIATALQQGTGAGSPAPAGDPSGTGSAAANGAGPAPAGQPEADDFAPSSIKEYLAQNPEHAPIVERVTAEMKRGLTPKLMEGAEARKKLEGLDDAFLTSAKELRRMIENDPAGAGQYLIQYGQSLLPAQQQQMQQQVPEFATDEQAALYKRIQDLEGKLERTSRGFETLSLQQQAHQVGDQFNKISAELGVEIPLAVRQQCFEEARRVGGALSATEIYFAKNRDAVFSRIAQRARDEAAGVVQTKAAGAAGNPAGVVPRAGQEEPEPTELKDILRAEIRKRQT